jgi:hypothetical protein
MSKVPWSFGLGVWVVRLRLSEAGGENLTHHKLTDFGFRYSDFLRISAFGIRVSFVILLPPYYCLNSLSFDVS